MAILNCPGCGRGGLRVPDGRHGKVTCPTCGAEWFYPQVVELSEVEFRCSSSGARFVVVLGRRSPLHKFVIQGIKNAARRTPAPSDDARGMGPSAKHPIAAPPAPPLLPLRARSWLARIPSFKGDIVSNEGAVADRPEPAPPLMTYSAEQFNWSSFFCPYCNAGGFIKCGGGHLACDGSVQVRAGGRFHQCFCGNAGFISGTIETFEGTQSAMTIEPAATMAASNETNATVRTEPNAIALPPTKGTSSKRDLP
jgi:hypothetical protein